MHLFRMLCIYYPINFHVKNANVDEERMQLLTSYRDCMLAKFKENVTEANDLRLGLQEILEDGLAYGDDNISYRIPSFYEDGSEQYDTANDHIVYDLAGYLLHARQHMIQCSECWKTLSTSKENLPGDF